MPQLAVPILTTALGAGASMFGASKAADAQTQATNRSIAAQREMFGVAQDALQPFVTAGQGVLPRFAEIYNDPYFMDPISLTPEALEAMPGYQFLRDEGLKATQRGYAAKGLGSSGAAMKGAARFATGLADSSFKTLYDVESSQRKNIFDRIMAGVGMGSGAAGTLGGAAVQTGQGIGQSYTGQGNAQAAAYTSMGQTAGNALTQIGGMAYMKPVYDRMYLGG